MMEGNLVVTSCGFTLDIYYRKHLNSYKKLLTVSLCDCKPLFNIVTSLLNHPPQLRTRMHFMPNMFLSKLSGVFFAITETRLSDSDIQHFAFSFLQGTTENCSTPFSITSVKSCTLQKALKMNVANWLPAVKCV